MKLTVALLILVAVSRAAEPDRKSEEENRDEPDERGLVKGNSGIDKRAPLLPTAAPAAGGARPAATTRTSTDRPPSQQIYATAVPQISKISDFLTGQEPSFQSAVDSHLYSPVSVYNPKFDNPTTYEVSAPVPFQLAYSEHRQSVPSPNSLQYNPKPQTLVNYVQSQPSLQQRNLGYEPVVHQVSNNAINNNFQPVQYNEAQQGLIEQQQQQRHYVQGQSIQIIPRNIQQHPFLNKKQHLEQKDLKIQAAAAQGVNKQNIQQVYNDKPQEALSFASFTYNPSSETPAPSYDQTQNRQLYTQSQQYYVQSQQQSQPQLQPQAPLQHQYQAQQIIAHQQPQPQQYQARAQPFEQIPYQHHPVQLPQIPYQVPRELQYQPSQQLQYQPQTQIQYQEEQPQFHQQQQLIQPQLLPQDQAPQYFQQQTYQLQQPQPQYFEKSEPTAKQTVADKQYTKQSPIQPRLNQQIYPQQPLQNLVYKQPVPAIDALPTFPPVEYFGKFAHSIFGNTK